MGNTYFMKKKNILIIGGGVSGLSCGIYCLKNGFNTTILEKTNSLGGNLTGWYRNNCYIDNCIHWLNGSKENNFYNKLWKEIGAINNETKFYQSDFFYASEYENKVIGLSKNLMKTKENMLNCCKDDKKEISKFIKACNFCCKFLETKNGFKKVHYFLKMFNIYGKKSLFEVSKMCKNEHLKRFFTDFILGEYSVYVLILAYCSFVIGDGKVLKDGSLNMAKRISETYENLGGKVFTNSEVIKVIEKSNKITSVETNDGKVYKPDFVVFACDPKITFEKMLKEKYMPKNLKSTYKNRKNYPIVSSFHVAYDVNMEKIDIQDAFVFECRPIKIGATNYNRLMVKNYDYGEKFAPKGHSVLQIFILQREQDYDFFSNLNRKNYKTLKKKISEQITAALLKRFPQLKGKITLLDCWTPLTYTHYFNSYKGSYMTFGITNKIRLSSIPCKIKELKNAYLSTQWQTLFGGLPNALMQGKKCATTILKNYKKTAK